MLWLLLACGPKDDIKPSSPIDSDGDGVFSIQSGGQDCDDQNAAVYPGATEVCNGLDDDCDGQTDDDDTDLDPSTTTVYFQDSDGDGYGIDISEEACLAPQGFASLDGDCDDSNELVFPASEEYCDGLDNDCNQIVDDEPVDALLWFVDSDGDGYGMSSEGQMLCDSPVGYSVNDEDCDDSNPNTHPSGMELCDGLDNDCNQLIDAEDPLLVDGQLFFLDADGDGYGDPSVTSVECELPEGYTLFDQDCNDSNALIHPAMPELCNGLDDDCSESLTGNVNIEDDLAHFAYLSGSVESLSTIYSSPQLFAPVESGTLFLCPGTAEVSLDLSFASEVAVVGIGEGVLWKRASDQPIEVVSDLSISNVQLEDHQFTCSEGNISIQSSTLFESETPLVLNDCHFTADDLIAEYNTGVDGAVVWADNSTVEIISSLFQHNTASGAGGAIWANQATLETEQTLFENNSAVSGGAAFIQGGELTCVGSTSTSAGFLLNSSEDAAVVFDEETLINAAVCDFGQGYSNDPLDLQGGSSYQAEQDVSFQCVLGDCGSSNAYSVGVIPIDSRHPNDAFRGNVFDVIGTPTLDSFEFRMDFSFCEFDHYVFERTSPADPWVELWSSSSVQGGSNGWASSSAIGIALTEGTQILLGAGWDCQGSPDIYRYISDTVTNYGLGSWSGETSVLAGYVVGDEPFEPITEEATYLYEQRIFVTHLQ